ncbi:MAG: MBL fold metallo-hydrolase [Paraglaciecola sp.]|nr:MBL fold metallo-hydrolase [Paraglaciecola sp.]NCT48435.1 MBL fold metallo-hydrolase [Paraglaciecola sp.]
MAIIRFLGAAQEVTGSCHMLESPALGMMLLDCGMHQGSHAIERAQHEAFLFAPRDIDGVILSHAHLDHSGMLPKLVHDGFTGPIHCTPATASLLEIMLQDSVHIYLSDLERENLQRMRKGKVPLVADYTEEDVATVLANCVTHPYAKPVQLTEFATLTFHDAGHILGSAITELCLQEKGQLKTLVFSGDLGNSSAVLMNDPSIIEQADVVLMEGTYGDRNHRCIEDTLTQLTGIIEQTEKRGGNIMIPAFAVGRTQELLFYLGQLHHQGVLQNWQVILDSPMAIKVSKVYDDWFAQLDNQDIAKVSPHAHSILKDFIPHIFLASSPEESMAINKISKGAIILAGSGMCTGGRIRHHFKQRIWDSRNSIIFCGYQAQGTLGRLLVDGKKNIKLFNQSFVVKAQIETLGGFSAHAGQSQLLEWVANFNNEPRVVLVHGEPQALDSLAEALWQQQKIKAYIPSLQSSLAF